MDNREVWKDIKGYEGKYQISNTGRVWSVGRQSYLKGGYDKDGYHIVALYAKNGKCKYEKVHRLVAINFIGEPPSGKTHVNHKDENPANNNVDNLEWCDAKYNNNYGAHNEKLSRPVRCVELDKIFYGAREAERQLGVDHSMIIKCCKGKRSSYKGYHWEYVNVS